MSKHGDFAGVSCPTFLRVSCESWYSSVVLAGGRLQVLPSCPEEGCEQGDSADYGCRERNRQADGSQVISCNCMFVDCKYTIQIMMLSTLQNLLWSILYRDLIARGRSLIAPTPSFEYNYNLPNSTINFLALTISWNGTHGTIL